MSGFCVKKKVKILEIRENYSCKQFFGVSFKGTALAIPAGSEPTFHPSKDREPRLWAVVPASDWLVPLYGLTIVELPKCLH